MKPKTKILVLIVTVIAFCSIVVATLFGLNTLGVLRLFETPISIKIEDYTTTYNAEKVEANFPYQITSGGLISGDSIEVTTKEEIINAGTYQNVFEVKIIDRNGQNVSSSYDINIDMGEIEVSPIEITLQSATAVFPNDGEVHSDFGVSIIKGSLINNDYFDFSNFKEFTVKGYHENKFTAKVFTEENEDVTFNYDITYQYGYIIITDLSESGESGPSSEINYPEKVTSESDIQGAPGALKEGDGGEYKAGGEKTFETIFNYTPTVAGSSFFKISSDGDYTKKGWKTAPKYKSKYGVNPQEFITDLLRNHKERYFSGSLEYVSITQRDMDIVPWHPILKYKQVTDTYSISSDLKSKTINTEGYMFDYIKDYSLLENTTFSSEDYVNEEKEYRKFVYDNYLQIPDSTKTSINNYINKYNLNTGNLLSTINKIIAHFKTYFLYDYEGFKDYLEDDVLVSFLEKYKVGDCSRFSGSGVLMLRAMGYPARRVGGYGVPGYAVGKTYSVNPWAGHAIAEVYIDGKGWVGIEFTVADLAPTCVYPPSWDVSDNGEAYDLILSTDDIVEEYNGSPVSSNQKYLLTGELKDGDSLVINNNNTLYNCGYIDNIPSYLIVDSNFNDVTSKYKIKEDFGKIVMNQKDLTLETDNATFSYDGNEHNPTYKISGLVNGDKVDSVVIYPAKELGTHLSVVIINSIKNASGEDVTANYNITYVFGHIRVE